MTTFNPTNSESPFLPQSQTFSEDQKQYLIQATNRDRDIARYLNIRQIGIYDLTENLTGQQFPGPTPLTKKQSFRKIFEIGAITAGASLILPTGITGITSFTQLYGTVITAIIDYRPIPYSSTSAVTEQISLRVDQTTNSIVIDVGSTSPNVTSGMVILEYLKN